MMIKYAKLEASEILDIKGSSRPIKSASLTRFSEFEDYRTEDGYLYARIRAISSRVNKNNDGWPSEELAGGPDLFEKFTKQAKSGFTVEASRDAEYGFSTFLGKPIFVDHNNHDPQRARGVIVDAKLHVEDHKTSGELDPYYSSAPDNHMPPTWVELLLEVDADSFPKLAKAIVEGSRDASKGIDGFSMGCDVEKTKCNICEREASSPDDYCFHVQNKGASFDYDDPKTGRRTSKKAYEDCYGIRFFEISAVFDPADETALVKEVRHARVAATHQADNPIPQDELTTAPDEVNTLRQEHTCSVCGSTMEGAQCDVCGYVEPPQGMGNPDLHGRDDQLQDPGPQLNNPTSPSPTAPNIGPTAKVNNEMAWKITVHPRTAGKINSIERPIQPGNLPQTNEPKTENTIQDQTKPITARTANDLLAAARKRVMDRTAEDNASASAADKQVDVTGVGGVDQASNEQASRADAQVDVTAQGGTGVESVDADRTEDVEKGGDEHAKNIEGTPTQTFPDNGTNPVQGPAFPTSANKGTQPVDPVGKAQDRVDLEKVGPTPEPQSGTDQWTGTDGNGVTRQQDPVTREVDPNITVSKTMVDIFKLADLEVELGLLSSANKYSRIAELQRESAVAVASQLRYAQRIKVAGLGKNASVTAHGVGRVPSLSRSASTNGDAKIDSDDDESLFL